MLLLSTASHGPEEGERFRGRTAEGQQEEKQPSTLLSQVSGGSGLQGKLIRKLAKYMQVLKIGLAGSPGSPELVLLLEALGQTLPIFSDQPPGQTIQLKHTGP